MPHKQFKYLLPITWFFVAVLLISNITSTKIIDLWVIWWLPIIFDWWTLLFPLSYIFCDILTEVYGFRQSRKVIWIGFWAATLMSLSIWLIWALPPSADRWYQEAYMAVLWYAPRIVLASLIAYLVGEFFNAITLAKMKLWTQGKHFRARAIGSTVVWQGLDTVIFVVIAFWGTLPLAIILSIILTNYIFKLLVEVVLLPLTYYITGKLKSLEHQDAYDRTVSFSPFGR